VNLHSYRGILWRAYPLFGLRCAVLGSLLGFSVSSGAQGNATLPQAHNPDAMYLLGPDSKSLAGVPEGTVVEFLLKDSKQYPGFEHKWWLYIPARYDKKTPLALMVFQDGSAYVDRNGPWRVPVVFDNLIQEKKLPPMAAVFVESGVAHRGTPDGSPSVTESNRSVEYDTLDSRYATFLLTEILPEARKLVRITDDPEGRGIAGFSSGGICAFTVAWQRPDQFRKVASANGSFTNIRGGNVYPDLVLQSERKPIRIFQQSGEHDLVNPQWGVWSEANKRMAAALDEKGYDHQFVFGVGSHNPAHAASIFPDTMRWLWRDYPR
jgi:enterochelin esterase-like enzyme